MVNRKLLTKNLIVLIIVTGVSMLGNIAHSADEPFNVSMNLVAPIAITENNALIFPNTIEGTGQTVVVATGDAGNAADFSVTGEASTNVTVSVLDASVTLNGPGPSTIIVDTWTFAPGASTAFDGGGALSIQVGASATVEAADPAGAYTGATTLRVVYQ
jgi:hypothetical protein